MNKFAILAYSSCLFRMNILMCSYYFNLYNIDYLFDLFVDSLSPILIRWLKKISLFSTQRIFISSLSTNPTPKSKSIFGFESCWHSCRPIEFKLSESLSDKCVDVSYAIEPKDEKELLEKGKKPRDLNGKPLESDAHSGWIVGNRNGKKYCRQP